MLVVQVLNEDDANPGQYPYIVSLQRRKAKHGYVHICGATIIHPLILLTAANCLQGVTTWTGGRFRAMSGAHNLNHLSGNEQVRHITDAITHPGWDNITKVNDIALIVLTQPLNFDEFTQPIPLATTRPNSFSKMKLQHKLIPFLVTYFHASMLSSS